MDEKKMTQEEKDFIDRLAETAKDGAAKLGKGAKEFGKAALKTAAIGVATTGIMLGGADLLGMEISEAQAARAGSSVDAVAQPNKATPRSVRAEKSSGGRGKSHNSNNSLNVRPNKSGGHRGGSSYSAPTPAPAQNFTFSSPSNIPSPSRVFENTLAYNGANLLSGVVTDLFGLNGYGGLLYDTYGYNDQSAWHRRQYQLARAGYADWERAYGNGAYATVTDGVVGLQRAMQPVLQNEPDQVVRSKLTQVLTQALENEKKLIEVQKGVDNANKKLDDQKLTLDEMKKLQEDAAKDAEKYHNEQMRAIDSGNVSITNNQLEIAKTLKGVSDKVDTISTSVNTISADVKDISDKQLYYILALLGLGVPLAAAIIMGRIKFNVVGKQIEGVDKKVDRINDATLGNFKQLNDLLGEVGYVRDATDATFGKVHKVQADEGSKIQDAYDRTMKRLADEKAKKEKEEKEI